MVRAETILGLVHLVVNADGEVKEKELELVNRMIHVESLSDKDASDLLNKFKGKDAAKLLDDCIRDLRKTDKVTQINFLAWLCVIANADGFMDQEEWSLIYRVYHKELNLETNEVMNRQKEINKTILNKNNVSFGIKVND